MYCACFNITWSYFAYFRHFYGNIVLLKLLLKTVSAYLLKKTLRICREYFSSYWHWYGIKKHF